MARPSAGSKRVSSCMVPTPAIVPLNSVDRDEYKRIFTKGVSR